MSQLTFLSSLVLYSLVTSISTFLTLLTLFFDNLCNLMSTFGLTQVVDNYTHLYQDSCHSLIDLVLLSNPSFLSSCQTIPPLSNSDHLGIWVEIKFKHVNKPVRSPPPPPPPPPGILFGIIPRQTGTGHVRELKPLTGMLGWLKTSTSPGPNGIQTS